MIHPLQRLFTLNLRVKRRETVLVLADVRLDRPRPITALAAQAADAGRAFARIRFSVYPETGRNGIEPPETAWVAAFGALTVARLKARGLLVSLLDKRATPAQMREAVALVRTHRRDAVDAALFMTLYSATHTKFRSLLSDAARARVASMPGFEARMLDTVMAVNWKRMAGRTRRVAARLDRARRVRICNADGTDLSFSVQGRRAVPDTGLLQPGQFGNLPAGEAFVAPVEGSANGILAARSGPAGVFPSGIRFGIRTGRVREVLGGGREGRWLGRLFSAHPEFGVVAEFGVGTNDRAKAGANILEAEKILGTIHVAFGDNATFGGRNRAAFHQDFLVRRPTVTLTIGRRAVALLDRGRLLD